MPSRVAKAEAGKGSTPETASDIRKKEKISTERDGSEINIIVNVAENDVGKVIGKNGRIAQSIRAIVKSISAREKIRYNVKINK